MTEVEVYLDSEKTAETLAKLPNREEAKTRIERIRNLFEPYIEAGKSRSFDVDMEFVPGIHATGTHGHTPDHTSYVVESKGETLIVVGDSVHVAAVQFEDPWANAASDKDPEAARFQRNRIFRLAADHGYWVAAAHLTFPGLGHIGAEGERYRWIPKNYTIARVKSQSIALGSSPHTWGTIIRLIV